MTIVRTSHWRSQPFTCADANQNRKDKRKSQRRRQWWQCMHA